MQVGFGLITCQRHPDDRRSDADLYQEAVKLSVIADRLGFDSVWTSEHHFLDDAYMPSLLVVSAAIAQATERIRIGTGVLLAPLYHPLRLAEDAATLDLLSGHRLILGLGAGWRAEEFELLGVDPTARGRAMRETVEILRRSWSDDAFDYRGKLWRLDGVNVTPKPAGPVPIWLGGFAPAAIARAGRIADGFLGSSTGTAGIGAFKQARDTAMDALAAAGRDPAGFTFALHVPVFAWDGPDAWQRVRTWYHYLRWKYPDMGRARGRSGPPAHPPPLDEATEASMRESMIAGTPDEVAEAIGAFRDALGDDIHVICRSYFAGMPYDVQSHSLQVLGERVIPQVR